MSIKWLITAKEAAEQVKENCSQNELEELRDYINELLGDDEIGAAPLPIDEDEDEDEDEEDDEEM